MTYYRRILRVIKKHNGLGERYERRTISSVVEDEK